MGVTAILTILGGMKDVICVSGAKTPIVKMLDPESGFLCDMNINSTEALENTRLIKTYVEIDPRVRPLTMIIKHWTKRRIINDAGKCDQAYNFCFSSHTQ
jgi:DNA polymerase sigma